MKTLLLILLIFTTSFSAEKYKNLFNLTINDIKEQNNIPENGDSNFINVSLNNIEKKLDYLHNRLNYSSKYIDEYITNEKDDLIYKDSFIRIENSIEKFEGKGVKYEPNIDIKIVLPKLKDKLSITIDNNDEDIINQEYQDSSEKLKQNDDNYNIGLLYNDIKKDVNLKFKIGLKTTNSPYFYTQGSVSKNFVLNQKSSIKVEEKLKYSHKYKFDNYLSFKYNYIFNPIYSFHNYNEYHINSKEKDNTTHNSIRLHHKLSNLKFLNYVATVESNDIESNFKIKEYETYISYRQFLRKWLYFDVVPSLRWYEDNDFDRNFGLKLTLGILISK